MFHELAEDIAFLLIKNKVVDIEDRDIYVYGAETLLLNLLNILTALIISLLTGTMIHFAVFTSVFVPLRIFSGGFHFKTSDVCYVVTTLVYTATVILFKVFPDIYSNIFAQITMAAFIILLIIFTPVENHNNPLEPKVRARDRVISIALATADYLIFIALAANSLRAANSVMIFIVVDSVLMILGLIKK